MTPPHRPGALRHAPPARRRAVAWAAALAAAAACASSGGGAPPDAAVDVQQSARVAVPGAGPTGVVEARTRTEDFVRATAVAVPPDRAWPAVVGAYEDLKLPVTLREDARRQIASQGRRFRGSLGGTRLGLLFNCGGAPAGGDAADSYELTVDVSTAVAAASDGPGSRLQTVASALGRPVMTSGEPVRCVSTGRLEAKIAEAAARRLVP